MADDINIVWPGTAEQLQAAFNKLPNVMEKEEIQEAISLGYSSDYSWPDDAHIEIVPALDNDGKYAIPSDSKFFYSNSTTEAFCVFKVKDTLTNGTYHLSFDFGTTESGRMLGVGPSDGTSRGTTVPTLLGFDDEFATRSTVTILVSEKDGSKITKMFFDGNGVLGASLTKGDTKSTPVSQLLTGGCIDLLGSGTASGDCYLKNFNYEFNAE